MTSHSYESHLCITARLNRMHGDPIKLIAMVDRQVLCADAAQSVFAMEKTIPNAQHLLLHENVDHCLLSDAGNYNFKEFNTIAKHL